MRQIQSPRPRWCRLRSRSPARSSRPRRQVMPNGRCKVHGGKSTGPRTPEGLERSRRANWKHGYYSREAKAERSRVRVGILVLRYLRMLGIAAKKHFSGPVLIAKDLMKF